MDWTESESYLINKLRVTREEPEFTIRDSTSVTGLKFRTHWPRIKLELGELRFTSPGPTQPFVISS